MIRDLQQLLLGIYDLDLAEDVRDYLITDRNWLGLDSDDSREFCGEQLFVEERDGELGLALFLDPAVVGRLAPLQLSAGFSSGSTADLLLALEGVSHFNYVAWNAARDKAVTLLELELQAEIDKFVTAGSLPGADSEAARRRLLDQLFDAPGFDPALAPAARDRYADANRLAARYCRSLSCRYPAGRPRAGMLRELRQFYRWPQPAKLSHIQMAATG
ncbi:MAG: hypothetical protein FJ197_04175 [Gammaproteobacteria bacterium]|nr:hypothetical protein [Gammaproteobacteria bacterium]